MKTYNVSQLGQDNNSVAFQTSHFIRYSDITEGPRNIQIVINMQKYVLKLFLYVYHNIQILILISKKIGSFLYCCYCSSIFIDLSDQNYHIFLHNKVSS